MMDSQCRHRRRMKVRSERAYMMENIANTFRHKTDIRSFSPY